MIDAAIKTFLQSMAWSHTQIATRDRHVIANQGIENNRIPMGTEHDQRYRQGGTSFRSIGADLQVLRLHIGSE